MPRRLTVLVAAFLCHAASLAAQPAPSTPTSFTFYYDYTVLPGKEAEFLDVVKTVGGPVRDKLMADGVISEWGVERPMLRMPGKPTLSIWYVAPSLDAVGKVQAALAEALAKPVAAAGGKGAVRLQGDRARDLLDVSKTRDWLIRDLESGYGSSMPPAGAQPWVRYVSYKVKAGMGADFRRVFDKYNKPLLEALVKDGTVEAWGLAVEELKSTSEFTHLLWYVTSDLAAMDKARVFVTADRDKRTEDERAAITAAFAAVTDPDASRGDLAQIVILKMASQK